MSKNVEMEDWKNFFPRYRTQVERLGSRTSHPEGCTSDFPEPCGGAVVDDPHIKAVWGINSGIGFGAKKKITLFYILRGNHSESATRYSRVTRS